MKLFLKGSLIPKKLSNPVKEPHPSRDMGARREVEIPRYLCTTLHTVYNASKLLIDSIKFPFFVVKFFLNNIIKIM